jgi:TolB protein
VVPAAGGAPRQVTHRPRYFSWEPSLSPVLADGSTWIVFESHTSGNSPGEIWKIRTDGTGVTRLTSAHALHGVTLDDSRQPEWSPRGDKIVFQRYMPGPGTWAVLTMDPEGGHVFNVTGDPVTDDTDPSWSPSGKYIVYSAGGPDIANANLFVIPASGGRRIRATRSTGYDGAPGWSADGATIAFESAPYDPDNAGNTRIWVIAAPKGIR